MKRKFLFLLSAVLALGFILCFTSCESVSAKTDNTKITKAQKVASNSSINNDIQKVFADADLPNPPDFKVTDVNETIQCREDGATTSFGSQPFIIQRQTFSHNNLFLRNVKISPPDDSHNLTAKNDKRNIGSFKQKPFYQRE